MVSPQSALGLAGGVIELLKLSDAKVCFSHPHFRAC
jgi:hypothetical protein